MNFKPALFALSSLVILVVASPLGSRQAGAECSGTLQCCNFSNLNDGDAQLALQSAGISAIGLTGMVGSSCIAPTPGTNDCGDSVHLGCCQQIQSGVATGCTEYPH